MTARVCITSQKNNDTAYDSTVATVETASSSIGEGTLESSYVSYLDHSDYELPKLPARIFLVLNNDS